MNAESALAVFVGAYLNQDLFDLYEDEFAALDDFAMQDPKLVRSLPDEITAAVQRNPDEDSLRRFLGELGIEVEPSSGLTYREWLTQIADRVRATTG